MNSKDNQELNGVDGEPVESEWNIFPGHTRLKLLHEIQTTVAQSRIKPENFWVRIIFMSMYHYIDKSKS